MTRTVSIIIPVKDQASRLALTLAALSRQDVSPGDFEVIVVDDGSEQPVRDSLLRSGRELGFALQVIETHSRGFRGLPRNEGAALARGDVLVFLDADACPSRQFVARHRDAHAAHAERVSLGDCHVIEGTQALDDPALGIPFGDSRSLAASGTSLVVIPVDELLSRGDAALEPHATKGVYPRTERRHRQLEELFVRGSPLRWAGIIPHNLSLRRTTFEALGGFDLGLLHCEGWDLGLRALRRGRELTWIPGARSFHLYHARSAAVETGHHDADAAVLRARYPDAGIDAVALWWQAMAGEPYLPGELDVSNPLVLERWIARPGAALELQQLRARRARLVEPSPTDYWLGAINTVFTGTRGGRGEADHERDRQRRPVGDNR